MNHYQELKRSVIEDLKVDLFPYLVDMSSDDQKKEIKLILEQRAPTYVTYTDQEDEFLRKFDKGYFKLVDNEQITIGLYDYESHKSMYVQALARAIFSKIAEDIIKLYSKKRINSFIMRQ